MNVAASMAEECSIFIGNGNGVNQADRHHVSVAEYMVL
jgi:hypothetical protein